jgi:hypothetical protein
MRTDTGWWLFGTIWALATAGIVKKLWFRHRFPKIALASYLAMGWLVVIAAPQMAAAIGPNGMAWLIAGGISYSVGAIFYALNRIPFNHAVWHVFALMTKTAIIKAGDCQAAEHASRVPSSPRISIRLPARLWIRLPVPPRLDHGMETAQWKTHPNP